MAVSRALLAGARSAERALDRAGFLHDVTLERSNGDQVSLKARIQDVTGATSSTERDESKPFNFILSIFRSLSLDTTDVFYWGDNTVPHYVIQKLPSEMQDVLTGETYTTKVRVT